MPPCRGALFLLAYRLSLHSYRAALATWMAGLLLAIFGGAWLLGNPNLLLLAIVLPLLAAMTAGGIASLIVELILVVLVWSVSQTAWGAGWSESPALFVLFRGRLQRAVGLGSPP